MHPTNSCEKGREQSRGRAGDALSLGSSYGSRRVLDLRSRHEIGPLPHMIAIGLFEEQSALEGPSWRDRIGHSSVTVLETIHDGVGSYFLWPVGVRSGSNVFGT